MADVTSRELRNDTRALLDRVAAGESIRIVVDGRPVAALQPLGSRPQWMPREQFLDSVLSCPAEAALARDLQELAPDNTDDLPS
jgi:prevent-host-death family protein